MSLTPAQIALVTESLPAVLAFRDRTADLFHRRLSAIDPAARPLFAGASVRRQGARLVGAIAMVIQAIGHSGAVSNDVGRLAAHHAGHGVDRRDYENVRQALLWTLEQILGPTFTPEMRAAWAAAYRVLSTAMMRTVDNPMAA